MSLPTINAPALARSMFERRAQYDMVRGDVKLALRVCEWVCVRSHPVYLPSHFNHRSKRP